MTNKDKNRVAGWIEEIKNLTYGDGPVNDEAKIGARWWANCLRDPDQVRHDAGDIEVNAMANWARDRDSRNDEFDAEKVDEFEKKLAKRLQEKIEDRRWDYQQPFVGNTTVRCDYHADPVLQDVAEEVGLEISSMTTFPIKTTMWLDPGEVRVKTGHSAEIRTLWEVGDYLEDIKDHVSGWVWTAEHPERDVEFEPEPKVFPTFDGYIVRAYGDYSPAAYGPEHRNFKITTEDIEADGLEAVLERLEEKIETWRKASGGGG